MWITTSEESNSCLSLLIWSLHYSDLLFCSISLSLSLSLVPAFWWLTRRASFSPFLHFRNAKDAYENKKRNTSNCVSVFLFLSLHADKGARMHTTKSINSNSPRWGVPLSLRSRVVSFKRSWDELCETSSVSDGISQRANAFHCASAAASNNCYNNFVVLLNNWTQLQLPHLLFPPSTVRGHNKVGKCCRHCVFVVIATPLKVCNVECVFQSDVFVFNGLT